MKDEGKWEEVRLESRIVRIAKENRQFQVCVCVCVNVWCVWSGGDGVWSVVSGQSVVSGSVQDPRSEQLQKVG